MSAFADTNWLESLYIKPCTGNKEAEERHRIVERRMRKQSGPLLISHIVLLEARNAFGRVTDAPKPVEWEDLLADFNGRLFVDTMNWDLLREQTNLLFERFSHKATIGTFDATVLASAQLAGAREILSFDERLKAIATCQGMEIFPGLGAEGKALLAQLRR